jgi:hypothetical protein
MIARLKLYKRWLYWRIETFTSIPSDKITFVISLKLLWQYKKAFIKYLCWVKRMKH